MGNSSGNARVTKRAGAEPENSRAHLTPHWVTPHCVRARSWRSFLNGCSRPSAGSPYSRARSGHGRAQRALENLGGVLAFGPGGVEAKPQALDVPAVNQPKAQAVQGRDGLRRGPFHDPEPGDVGQP